MKKVEANPVEDANKFLFVGNNLCIDFINTLIAVNGKPFDLLNDSADLAAWAKAAGLLEAARAKKFSDKWSDDAKAKTAFKSAIGFRKILFEMILTIKNGATVKPEIIRALNKTLEDKNGTIEIRQTADGFEKRFHAAFEEPRQLLAPVAESAADLLCYARPEFIKKCEAADCVLYFYDTTKNHSRRWCSMTSCGNRAKAAAFYQRKKTKTSD